VEVPKIGKKDFHFFVKKERKRYRGRDITMKTLAGTW